jgi:hypothetical protein
MCSSTWPSHAPLDVRWADSPPGRSTPEKQPQLSIDYNAGCTLQQVTALYKIYPYFAFARNWTTIRSLVTGYPVCTARDTPCATPLQAQRHTAVALRTCNSTSLMAYRPYRLFHWLILLAYLNVVTTSLIDQNQSVEQLQPLLFSVQ